MAKYGCGDQGCQKHKHVKVFGILAIYVKLENIKSIGVTDSFNVLQWVLPIQNGLLIRKENSMIYGTPLNIKGHKKYPKNLIKNPLYSVLIYPPEMPIAIKTLKY